MTATTADGDGAKPIADDSPGLRLPLLLAGGALVLGLLAGEFVAGGQASKAFAIGVLAIPVLLWFRPKYVPVLLVTVALTIEQFPYAVGAGNGAATDRIPLFKGLSGGAHVSLADLLFVMLLVFWLLKRGIPGVRPLQWSAVNRALVVLLGAVAFGVVVGTMHHGQLRVALMEVRPYAYLTATYLLVSVFMTSKEALRPILWAFVLGSGFKAAQGVMLFVRTRHLEPRPEALLGHEESVFFGIFILLAVALWLFQVRGMLRTTATLLLPLVLLADLTNSRRTAWVILFAGLIALVVVGFVCLPQRRSFLRRMMLVIGVISIAYFPAYWNKDGSLAQPARAIHSVIKPDKRDEASNLYRVQEDANLKYNIRQAKIFGKGFGVPIDYALPIVDLSSTNPLIAYIPHNGVLYIFMRLGIFGAMAFWSMVGIGIVTGCRLARAKDRELALIGALVVSVLLGYVFMGYNDQGFFFYRIAFVIGALLAVADFGLRTMREAEPNADSPAVAR